MKQFFLYAMAVLIPVAILLWLFLSAGKSLAEIFQDWRLGKELDELKADAEVRRRNHGKRSAERLDTGCEHEFDVHGHGLPLDTCAKCGIERVRPTGPCDHLWLATPGPVPSSCCTKCGKTHKPTSDSMA